MSVLVIDVGTTGVRSTRDERRRDARRGPLPAPPAVDRRSPASSSSTRWRWRPSRSTLAREALAAHGGPVAGVGITAQRASTIVWDRATGEPVGPASAGRTCAPCSTASPRRPSTAWRLAPNQSATKVAWLLNTFDPDRARDLCFGTVDSWIAWILTGGAVARHRSLERGGDRAVRHRTRASWSDRGRARSSAIPATMLPALVDSSGVFGEATALPGAPPLAALVGDQQGSLVGQSCVRPGDTKITFGTGGMLDVCVGPDGTAVGAAQQRTARSRSSPGPIDGVPRGASRRSCSAPAPTSSGCATTSALIADRRGEPRRRRAVRDQRRCRVRAGAARPRHAALGLRRTGLAVRPHPRVDAGPRRPRRARGRRPSWRRPGRGCRGRHRARRSDAARRRRDEREPDVRAGARQRRRSADRGRPRSPRRPRWAPGYLAGLAVGVWGSFDDDRRSRGRRDDVVEPTAQLDRAQWAEAVSRARGWIPDLSALDF